MSTKAPIVVVGAGYVGLITAVGFAKVRQVHLVDINETVLASLASGATPVWEPGLPERFSEVRASQRLVLHGSIRDALLGLSPTLIIVAVGTPTQSRAAGGENEVGAGEAADLSAVRAVIDSMSDFSGHAIVMKSTVPPGTGASLIERIRDRRSELSYLSCPEFLQEGEAFKGLERPDRVVVGRDTPSWASEELKALHEELYSLNAHAPPYLEMDVESAELVKHCSNLALSMKISYANEVANLCEELGGDVRRVTEGVGSDHRIGTEFLQAGIGFGGSCFEKDLRALRFTAERARLETSIIDAVLSVNERQAQRVIEKLRARLGGLEGKSIALLGLTFKPETDDLRGSPAFTLAGMLRDAQANIRAWDPQENARKRAVTNWEYPDPAREWLRDEEVASTALGALAGAHAAVVVTAWSELSQIDWSLAAAAMHGDLVLDGRNVLAAESVRAAGLRYEGTGRESAGLQGALLQAGER